MLGLGLLLTFLSALPVLIAAYPQMTDYPAHLARFHVMLSRDSSPYLREYYGFEWRWMGNLGADILIRPLTMLFPLETAGKIIAALIPVLTGLGILAVEWSLRKRIGLGSMLAFAFVWSPSALMGFLNFGLAQAAALLAFALWVRLEGKRWRAPLFVPIGIAVWLCHVSGWGMLGIMVFGYEWSRDKSWRAFLAPWPLAFPILAFVFWGTPSKPPSYGPSPEVYKWAIWKQAMRATLWWIDYASMMLICAAIVVSGVFKRWDGRLTWGAWIMWIASLLLPRHIFGGDYVDARMISAGLMVGCLALTWRAPRLVLLVAPLLFGVRLAYTVMDWERDSRETAQLLSAIDGLPQGARLAVYVESERREWGYNTQEHICGYAIMRLDAMSNCNFALPGVHMMTIREGGPFFRDPYHRLMHRTGKPIDTFDYDPARYTDWFWFVGEVLPIRLPEHYEEVARGKHWILMKNKRRALIRVNGN